MGLTTFAIDIGAPFFWVFLGLATIVIIPLTAPGPRRMAVALVNIAFIFFIAGPWGALGAALIALTIQLAAVAGSSSSVAHARRTLPVMLSGALVLILFVVHKRGPTFSAPVQTPNVRAILAAVGFSYVALRCVELLRAGAEGKARSVRWLDAVSYLFPFHMLAAGPIQSWHGFTTQDEAAARLGFSDGLDIIERIVMGLFKKFVLARGIEVAFLTGFRAPAPYLLFEIQVYFLWVYLDFSAYSDIAVGVGRLIGVATPENFDNPLTARNIVVFWSRWHISLSSFIQRNVFIPLHLALVRRWPGSHATLIATISVGISFVLVGLWHGITVRFAVWGALHGMALITCHVYGSGLRARLGRNGVAAYLANPAYRLVSTAVTFEFVALSLAFIAYPITGFLA